MGKRAIYEFYWDCGRMGNLEGLFTADSDDVEKLIGKEVYFGEVLGKHSDIDGTIEESDFTIKSDDQEFVAQFEEIMGTGTISGYNPFDYYDEEEEEEDE